jgi:uncharacterized protein (TIGR02757 family)
MDIYRELEKIYLFYNDKRFVHPDPLEFLYDYDDLKDREIVGIIAALLAYGKISQILKSVSKVLKVVQKPYDFLLNVKENQLNTLFNGFVHRFTTGSDIVSLLIAIKKIIEEYGTLGQCFFDVYEKEDTNILNTLNRFIKIIGRKTDNQFNSLVSKPDGSSAYKRFNLFLRWMVRKDNVDPGGWDFVDKSKLLIPLDTHMYRVCCEFNFTKRKQSDIRTVIEITNCFREINPQDPVKYDFALTRMSMQNKEKIKFKLPERSYL